MFVQLKPLAERKESADKIIARPADQARQRAGAKPLLNPVQDIRVGGRQANATYQYTLQGGRPGRVAHLGAAHTSGTEQLPQLVDVNTDQQDKACRPRWSSIRDTAARLGVSRD